MGCGYEQVDHVTCVGDVEFVSAGALGGLAAGSQEVSLRDPSVFPHNPTTPPTQHQLRPFPRRLDSFSPRPEHRPQSAASQRTLRRTPRFSSASPSPRPAENPRRGYLEAATVGYSPPPLFSLPIADARSPLGQPERVFSPLRRQLSQDIGDDFEEEEPSTVLSSVFSAHQPHNASPTKYEPPRASPLSRQTRSAILWALEEALRQPNPFSPDIVEENASMADLLGDGGPATTNGNGGSTSRPTAPPSQTGSPQGVIRGPRMIMRERQEREARQKAEREQMERIRAEEEARAQEETRRQMAERRQATVGAPPGGSNPSDLATARRQQRAQENLGGSRVQNTMPSSSNQQTSAVPPPLRPSRLQGAQGSQNVSGASQAGGAPAPPQAGESSSQALASNRIKNSFPHAFERWEALSAHWEGMTSFWLRRLQENTDEAERNPISSQLSRQVADLSAAGANLFHAVVELQRLRASSERKFQRWFFETRSELERHQEVNAMLEAQLEQERQSKVDEANKISKQEAENARLNKLVTEMRRELLISKEEARRAWEELGRKEQEERDRTVSLQQGIPTIVGGVQVVPMTQSIPSREPSRRERSQTADTSDYIAAQNAQHPEYVQAPGGQSGASSTGGHPGYYVPAESAPREPQYGAESEGGYDEEDYETPASQSGATSYPPSSSQQWSGTYTGAPEYSGQGYAAPGWEGMPRHHHPTRLSDVLEEDERSRTSASQVSRA
ncbi:hypothetical protein QBC35DRAFT_469849 [Podospora australis]|uniref:Uncharacterized protein n=1 Tax=Podospora australis TaxID=1536484 RepID=A0AAN6X437_9PEZI|nr:hypothetical protein QBC35DRAFT_469849 [Podospora australis]